LESLTKPQIFWILGIGLTIILSSTLYLNLYGEIIEKDAQIASLQGQIEDLESLIGPVIPGSWHLITSFGGMDDSTTDYFYCRGGDLRLNWTCFSSVPEFHFNVTLFVEGDLEPIDDFSLFSDQGYKLLRDLNEGRYFFVITVNQVDQWSLTVETWIS
jgi:hypothetical protein